MHPAIKYAFAALLLLGATISSANTGTWFLANISSAQSLPVGTVSDRSGINSLCSAAFQADLYHPTNMRYHRTRDISSTNVYCEMSNGGSWTRFVNWIQQSGTCPASIPYSNDLGQCTATPPEPQCSAGSDTFTVEYTPSEMAAPDFNTNQAIISNGDCLYDSTGILGCDPNTGSCFYEYTQTDNPASGGEPQPGSFEGTPPATTDGQANHDTGETTYTQDLPVTNPDGSTTQTSTETTTNTSGSGTEVWHDDNFVYMRDSTGTVSVYERQKTETVNPDNSATETVVTSKTVQTPTTKTTIINTGTGSATITTNSQGTTNGTTTTTVNTYDSNGNLTGSVSTTTGGSETQNEGDEEKEGNCGAPGQPVCDVSLAGSDKLTDPAGLIDAEVLPKLDEMIANLNGTGSGSPDGEFLELSPLDMYEGGSCDPNSFSSDYHGETIRPLQSFCDFYDSDMRPILAFFFYALTAWALYIIYVHTMRKT